MMLCYEWGRFYLQQIQAVGFYGGSEACVMSVMQVPPVSLRGSLVGAPGLTCKISSPLKCLESG